MALPWATRADQVTRAVVLAIGSGIVTVEGSQVATTRELRSETSPDWKVHELGETLELFRNNWMVVNPNAPFPGELLVLADRGTDFKVIKKVLYTAATAGYHRPSFVVRTAR